MTDPLKLGRDAISKTDEAELTKQEEGIQVAVQWAQEKIDNFLLEIEQVTLTPI